MNLEDLAPALVVILLLAGFVASFVWRLYLGPGEHEDASNPDGQPDAPPR